MACERRLIDANELLNTLRKRTFLAYPNEFYGLMLARNLIDNAPTVDAAEVVRCKDCKWRNTRGCPYMNFNAVARNDLDFCSDGERNEYGI